MGKDIRSWVFIAVAFLLGSINILYQTTFYVFFILSFLYFVMADWRGFVGNVKQSWKYLILPVGGVVYLILHYIINMCLGGSPYKASWGIVELLLMYFLAIPLYIVSAKSFMTPCLLKRFLLSLCWGILLFNFFKFFYLVRWDIFAQPKEALQMIYSTRFGSNMELGGGFVLLEAQALVLSVAAVISYFFFLQHILLRIWNATLWSCIIILPLSLLFLSFTVTKGAILAFGIVFFLLSLFYFTKLSRVKRGVFVGGIFLLLVGMYWSMPQDFKDRFQQMTVEVENVRQGDFNGGTVSPRLALWKEDFHHFDEWGLLGLGVYRKNAVKDWYQQSQYTVIHELRNTHNSFLDFWILGGIPGLLFLCYYFFAPIMKMIRQNRYSYLIIALILALFIANNTCLLIVLADSGPLMIFLFSMFFFYLDYFIKLEEVSGSFRKIQNV